MIVRIRSREGLERVSIPEGQATAATVATLQSLIESQLGIPVAAQTLSLDPNLLLRLKDKDGHNEKDTLSDPSALLSSLGLSHGSLLYLSSSQPRLSAPPPPPRSAFAPAGSFGRNKMTIDDLIARQIRITRQVT